MTAQTATKTFLVSITALVTICVGINAYVILTKKADVVVIDTIDQDIIHWQNVVRMHPTYQEGYLQLAKLYEQKGNIYAAKSIIKNARLQDPLNESVYEYGKVLGVTF